MSSKQSIQGRQDRLPWIAFALVLLIAATITAAYFVAGEQEKQQSERLAKRRATRGSACAVLREASGALQSGNRELLRSSIREAKRIAVEALNTTWVAFGQPEKQAIRLGNENLTSAESLQRVEDRLAAATESCSQIKS